MLTADELIDLEEIISEEIDRIREESEKSKTEREVDQIILNSYL